MQTQLHYLSILYCDVVKYKNKKNVVITITHAVDMANINKNQHLSQHSTVHIDIDGLDGQPVYCQESCLAYDYNYTSGGICV